jgi:hypothetical protein
VHAKLRKKKDTTALKTLISGGDALPGEDK